jgi:phospholipid/cholesterol/gamma-HCH transport system ATP-binding protein
MIQVEDLWKSFGGHEVLRGVSLHVEPGEFMALIGMSGTGKSILLKQIVRLMEPDHGRVRIEGADVATLSRLELEKLRGRIGYVFQSGALFDSMTVFDNVAFPLRETSRLNESQIRNRVMTELEQVGLADAEAKFPAQISGGMQKRVALARTLIREPEIILFDEPTTGLDPIISNSILQLFDSVHRRLGLTGILVSHEIPDIFRIVQKVALLHQGKIVSVGTPAEILASSDPMVRQFVHGLPEGPIQYR